MQKFQKFESLRFIRSLTFKFEIVDNSKTDTKHHFRKLNYNEYQNSFIPVVTQRINHIDTSTCSQATAAFTFKHLDKQTNKQTHKQTHTHLPYAYFYTKHSCENIKIREF